MVESLSHHSELHAGCLLSGMNRLRKSRHFCDVQLLVSKESYHAHRLVLAACSPYFEAMLSGGLSEESQDAIGIHGVEPDIFDCILDFIYTGHIEVTEGNAQGLLFAADMLQLAELKDICASFLKLQLHSSNCLGFLRFALDLSCHDLAVASRLYAHTHFSQTKEEEEFFDLNVDLLVELLQSEELRVEDEFEVFKAAMSWISHDASDRRKHLVKVLQPVRFPIIQPAQLFQYIEDCKDLSLRIATGKLVQDYDPKRRTSPATVVKVGGGRSQLPLSHHRPRKNSRKKLIVMGGYCQKKTDGWSGWGSQVTVKDVDAYDCFDQSWQTFPPLQQPKSAFGATVLGGTIYAIGGECESLLLQSVETYDAVEKCWVEDKPLLFPRSSHGVCVFEDQIYVFGGWVGMEMGVDIERFDPDEGVWTVHDKLTTLRSNFGVASTDGLVYIAGGASDTGIELRLLESYNPVIKEWTTLAKMRTRRSQCAMAVLEDDLYVVGGYNSAKNVLSSVEKYSIAEDKWTKVRSMLTPRACACVAVAHGRLYAIGGKGASKPNVPVPPALDTMECYDPQTDTWIDMGKMPIGRCEAAVAVL